jgi:hypothetical protein
MNKSPNVIPTVNNNFKIKNNKHLSVGKQPLSDASTCHSSEVSCKHTRNTHTPDNGLCPECLETDCNYAALSIFTFTPSTRVQGLPLPPPPLLRAPTTYNPVLFTHNPEAPTTSTPDTRRLYRCMLRAGKKRKRNSRLTQHVRIRTFTDTVSRKD